jgi:hypothetical protein
LHTLRSQIDRYRNQHEGRPPGTLGGADDDIEFAEQLTLPTNETGTRCPAPNQGVGNPNYPFGPYISTQLPSNPFNGSRRVKTVTEFPASAPGGDSASDPGWVYEISSGRIRLNQSGNAPDGTPFWNL